MGDRQARHQGGESNLREHQRAAELGQEECILSPFAVTRSTSTVEIYRSFAEWNMIEWDSRNVSKQGEVWKSCSRQRWLTSRVA